jgi:hypothetical protein
MTGARPLGKDRQMAVSTYASGATTLPEPPALVAQRIEHLTTDQKVGSSILSECTTKALVSGIFAEAFDYQDVP